MEFLPHSKGSNSRFVLENESTATVHIDGVIGPRNNPMDPNPFSTAAYRNRIMPPPPGVLSPRLELSPQGLGGGRYLTNYAQTLPQKRIGYTSGDIG